MRLISINQMILMLKLSELGQNAEKMHIEAQRKVYLMFTLLKL